MKKSVIAFYSMFLLILTTEAQVTNTKKSYPYSNRLSLQTGLLQDLMLDGQNIIISYTTQRWVFDWSHGISLDFSAGDHFKNNEMYNTQKLDVHMPWTTGPSIGYRITPFFNVRAEFKIHNHDVRYENTKTKITSFNTYTIGIGAFYEWYPFRKKDNWLQGILVEPVIRFWPNVGSSLNTNFSYNNTVTGTIERIDPYKLGWLANVNIGYTFGGK